MVYFVSLLYDIVHTIVRVILVVAIVRKAVYPTRLAYVYTLHFAILLQGCPLHELAMCHHDTVLLPASRYTAPQIKQSGACGSNGHTVRFLDQSGMGIGSRDTDVVDDTGVRLPDYNLLSPYDTSITVNNDTPTLVPGPGSSATSNTTSASSP